MRQCCCVEGFEDAHCPDCVECLTLAVGLLLQPCILWECTDGGAEGGSSQAAGVDNQPSNNPAQAVVNCPNVQVLRHTLQLRAAMTAQHHPISAAHTWTVPTLQQPASPLTPLLLVTTCCSAADEKASGSSVHHCWSSKPPVTTVHSCQRRSSRCLLCGRLRLLLLCTAARLLLGRWPLLGGWLCQQSFLLCPQLQPPQARSPAQTGGQTPAHVLMCWYDRLLHVTPVPMKPNKTCACPGLRKHRRATMWMNSLSQVPPILPLTCH
jgi:hypothetical protein